MHYAIDNLFILIVEVLMVLDSMEMRRFISDSMHLPKRRIARRKKLRLFLLNLVQSPKMPLIGDLMFHLV